MLPSATVDYAALHMGEHMDSVSPLARVGRAVLDMGLRAAVQYVADFRTTPDELGADRRRRMDIVNQCAADLQPLTDQCREHMPEHICRMKRAHAFTWPCSPAV